MKRCIEAHTVAAFGDIPVGSLWDDDSPYITDESKFTDARTPEPEPEIEKRPVKKSAAKKES